MAIANTDSPDDISWDAPHENVAWDNAQASTAGVTPEPQEQPLSWSDVPGQALRNVPSSGMRAAEAFAQPFIHPIQTAENIGSLAAGAAQKLGVAPGTSFEPYADALVDYYKQRYGSVEGLKHTLANDPVGVASDLSMFLGGAGLAERAPGIIGETAAAAGQAGRLVNPVEAAAQTARGVTRATGVTGSAESAAANQALADAGVLRTPGQRIGGIFRTGEEALSSVPILGAFIKRGRQNSVESFNQAVGNQALEPIGATTSAKAGHALVQDVEGKLGNAYDQLLPNLTFSADAQFTADMARIRNAVKNDLTGDRADQFDRIVQSRLPAASAGATFTGEEFKDIQSQLTHLAGKHRGAQDADQAGLGEALDRVGDAMKAGLARSNPQYADELNNINYGWAQYARMRSAAARRATSGGIFTPSDLLASVKSADKSVGKGVFAKGQALMQQFAEAGQKVLPSELPTSGTTERAIHAGLLLEAPHILAGALNPKVLAAGAAAAAPYTKLGMKATDLASRYTPVGPISRAALPAGRISEAETPFVRDAEGNAYNPTPRQTGGRIDGHKGLATKHQANYRGGSARHHCGICAMFVKPSFCTAVRGHISPRALCDFYEPKGKGERIVNNKYDVITGANSSKKPTGPIFIDRHIPEWSPKLRTKEGKRVRLWTYLSVHEDDEQKHMEAGDSYDQAHQKATKAERKKAEADGVDWKAYTEEVDNYLARVEHERVNRRPPVPLHVKPDAALKGEGHHHSSHKRPRRAGGGGVEDEPLGDLSPEFHTLLAAPPPLQIGVGPGFVGSSAPGAAPRPLEGDVYAPPSPNIAKAIARTNAWMQERAQREPQPVLQRNIEIMMRGGPMAEATAKHMLNTFQPHPSEALPSPSRVIDMGDE